MFDFRLINWTDPAARVSEHFSLRESIYLSKWGRLATEGDGLNDHVKEQICRMGEKMDRIREFVGLPIVVHRWYSPKGYNALVGGAKASKHMCLGPHSAVDWHALVRGETIAESCDTIRAALEPKLDELDIRMENNPGCGWVHTDSAEIVFSRYFKTLTIGRTIGGI